MIVVVVVAVIWQHLNQTSRLQRPLRLCCHPHLSRHLILIVLVGVKYFGGVEAQGIAGSSAPPENARAVDFRSLPAYVWVNLSVLQAGVAIRSCSIEWTAETFSAEVYAALLDCVGLRLRRWGGRAARACECSFAVLCVNRLTYRRDVNRGAEAHGRSVS
jgi:hypothetical protein